MADPRTGSATRDAAALVAARVVSAVVSAGTWFLLINQLSPAAYGGYALAVGIVALVITASDLGLTSSLARYLAEGSAQRRTTARVAAIRMLTAFVGMLVLVGIAWLMAGGTIPARDYQHMPTLFVLAGILVIARSLTAFAAGVLPAVGRMGWLAATTVLVPVAELAAVSIALSLGAGAVGAMWAAIVSAVVLGGIGMAVVLASTDHSDSDVGVRAVGSYSRSVFVVWLAFAAFTQIDQVIIWAFHGETGVAPYAAAWQVVTLLHLPGLAIATVIAPRLAREADPARRYVAGIALMAGLSAPLVACAMALAGVGYAAVLRPYVGQEEILWALGGYAFLLGMAPLATMAVNYLGAAARRVPVALGSLLLNIILDLALVPGMGALGAAIGTTAAFTVYTAAHVRLGYRLARDRSTLPPATHTRIVRLACVGLVVTGVGAVVAGELGRAGMQMAGPVAGLAVGILATLAAIGATWYALRVVGGNQWYLPRAWHLDSVPTEAVAEHLRDGGAAGRPASADSEEIA